MIDYDNWKLDNAYSDGIFCTTCEKKIDENDTNEEELCKECYDAFRNYD